MRRIAPTLALLSACNGPPSNVAVAPAHDAAIDATTDASADANPDAGVDAGTPDLTLLPEKVTADLAIEERTFSANACELDPDEACIGAPGLRRLLRFSLEIPNIGDGDLFLGVPDASRDEFTFSSCHNHFHLRDFASYRLLDEDGNEVAVGHKQAFCLTDTRQLSQGADVSASPRYSCSLQGIQRGWSDIYASGLPCQFVDITDTPPGTYDLELTVNSTGILTELDMSNNTIVVPVDLTDSSLLTPTEPCDAALSEMAVNTADRECDWTFAQTLSCTPGLFTKVGCSAACNIGECTGSPMLRVCDSENPDSNCSNGAAIVSATQGCFSECPATQPFHCPTSGSIDVYTAAKVPGDPYTCTLAIQ